MATNPDDPIGPVVETEQEGGHVGLTKREHFALEMMKITTTNAEVRDICKSAACRSNTPARVTMAIYAVDLADALIDALNGKPE